MCGRYTQTRETEALQARFKFEPTDIVLHPRYNLAPGQDAPVIVQEESRVLKLMHWGLVPSWAKETSTGYKMINARAETLTQKPSFKKSFQRRRCLVPADGFYEWRKNGGRAKTPLRFVLKSGDPFAFAGLWDIWQGSDEDATEGNNRLLLLSFTIITTEANDLIRPIHDRMPVILQPKDEDTWLDPDLKDVNKLASLLVPYPSDKMMGYEVSSLVNSPQNDTPECLLERRV
ncbi:MAG TPA: SOS response-associated peptidase [Candidatus Limnocylindrales bacterium]|nr:SOS response-associated peptidase [Candidatus Limnocylindrales bacterium]